MSASTSVDVLLLGTGWTGGFLVPLLQQEKVSFATTTRDGRDGSIPFAFDPNSGDLEPYKRLPSAKTIVIVFPVYVDTGYKTLLSNYNATHPEAKSVTWIQLGSTGSYDGGPTLASDEKKSHSIYTDRKSPVNLGNDRTRSEQRLLEMNDGINKTLVLHLCGLYGGTRSIRRYVGRIAGTKEQLAAKGAIHMVHGIDVARAILAVHRSKEDIYGQRWIVTDQRVYDWYDLASKWGTAGEEGRGKPMEGPQAQWVTELMQEQDIKSLPRSAEQLGRAITSVDFWQTMKISPIMGGQLD